MKKCLSSLGLERDFVLHAERVKRIYVINQNP